MEAKKLDFIRACNAILRCPKANGYAKSYANAGLGLSSDEERRVQALYILNNISAWRGQEAAATRAALKRLSQR